MALSLKKPAELVDVIEATALTLHDRRIYNLLINNAFKTITENKEHSIRKSALAELTHYHNDRLGQCIENLMSSIVRLRSVRDGKPVLTRVQLLGATAEDYDRDGKIYYRFPPELRSVLNDNVAYARLKTEVMVALSSKYALALYEMIQRRGNLKYQWQEIFTVAEFRELLGVPKGKLGTFGNLNARAIKPAIIEVNALADFGVSVEPLRHGGKEVLEIRMSWWKKSVEELKMVYQELNYSKVGRRARVKKQVEDIL
jgi:plasmid replication initiation protein